jgi:hypothetical protein
MKLAHIVFRMDSLTYLIARALATAGHEVHVWITDPEFPHVDPYRFAERLRRIVGVSLHGAAASLDPLRRYDRLIVQMFPRPQHMWTCAALSALAAKSDRITLISAGDLSRHRRTAYWLQWRELRLLGKWIFRVDRVAYKDGYHGLDLFMLFKSRRVVGFDVHSWFMDDAVAFAAVQAQDWAVEASRPLRVNFMGSQDPQERKRILDVVRPLLTRGSIAGEKVAQTIFWHEYSDDKPAALGLPDFLNVLTRSDFTLCPPGYSLVTHRVVEALLRGSIPVLHARELPLYDLELEDGVNCIAVAPEAWLQAIDRCLQMTQAEVIAMRRNIQALAHKQLLYPESSRRMRARLGVEA